jgi:hypothetical protein
MLLHSLHPLQCQQQQRRRRRLQQLLFDAAWRSAGSRAPQRHLHRAKRRCDLGKVQTNQIKTISRACVTHIGQATIASHYLTQPRRPLPLTQPTRRSRCTLARWVT